MLLRLRPQTCSQKLTLRARKMGSTYKVVACGQNLNG